MVEVHGARSTATLDSGRRLTVLQGGIVAGRDDYNVLTLNADTVVEVNSGGAVTAGARFDEVNGTPVAVQTGVGADAFLNSPHELFIGGTVTTSDEMRLGSGSPLLSHDDYFSTIAVVDPDHPLVDHTRYGILLTGTLTSLAANTELKLQSHSDVIVRGNIHVFGAGSDLLVQSDSFTYIESFIDVRDNAKIFGGVSALGNVIAPPVAPSSGTGLRTDGSSVYVHTTSRIVTRNAGSRIDIKGAADVDLYGAVVAGGAIGEHGVEFSGPGSTINVTSGQQLLLDTGLLASGYVNVTSGAPGPDDTLSALFAGHALPAGTIDDRLSLVVTTAGGISTSGETTNHSGGAITINAAGNIEVLGNLTAGAKVTQQFDFDGNFLGELFDYTTDPATLNITTTGRAFLGGHTFNEGGQIVQTGTYLRAAHAITVHGG
ncbi:MAG TPA: hypothetical protein PLV92_25125, partial [Pirellulaceae bacterium]|nr:hypothetical protein [Pirellulaceae bacterium]